MDLYATLGMWSYGVAVLPLYLLALYAMLAIFSSRKNIAVLQKI